MLIQVMRVVAPGQVLVFQAVAKHRMVVEQFENHGDLCAAIEVLQHDELADSAGIDALGVLGNQEELRLRVEESLPACSRTSEVGRFGDATHRSPDCRSEISRVRKIAFRSQLKRRADQAIGERPRFLVRSRNSIARRRMPDLPAA